MFGRPLLGRRLLGVRWSCGYFESHGLSQEHLRTWKNVLPFSSQRRAVHTVNDWERRPHNVSITDFGAVGDGKTLNTHAFENAFFYLRSYVDKGGAQLYIPAGRWLTGSITFISHLTLFLENVGDILGSEDLKDYLIVPGLPSYGRGRELPRVCHRN